MSLLLTTLASASVAVCSPGAHVEALAAGQWRPGTVVKRTETACVVTLVYSGVTDDWYLPFDKVRTPDTASPSPAPAAPAKAAGLCVKGAALEIRLQRRWYPAVVTDGGLRADGTCCVTHHAYAGIENDQDVNPVDIRLPSGAGAAGVPDVKPGRGTYAVTPELLYNAFKRDPKGSEAKYIGSTLRVTGRADVVDDKNILFKMANYNLVVQCLFEEGDRAQLRTVGEGDTVMVEGVATNTLGPTSVRLQECKVVKDQAAASAAPGPASPPEGRYYCMNAGSSVGTLMLHGGTYSIGGVSGSYRYNGGTKAFTWAGGSFAKWGWSGSWRTDSVLTNGPAEPRIELTDGASLHVHCFPKG